VARKARAWKSRANLLDASVTRAQKICSTTLPSLALRTVRSAEEMVQALRNESSTRLRFSSSCMSFNMALAPLASKVSSARTAAPLRTLHRHHHRCRACSHRHRCRRRRPHRILATIHLDQLLHPVPKAIKRLQPHQVSLPPYHHSSNTFDVYLHLFFNLEPASNCTLDLQALFACRIFCCRCCCWSLLPRFTSYDDVTVRRNNGLRTCDTLHQGRMVFIYTTRNTDYMDSSMLNGV
jgi:hypothetical protein